VKRIRTKKKEKDLFSLANRGKFEEGGLSVEENNEE